MRILISFFVGLFILISDLYGQMPLGIKFYLDSKQISKSAKDFYNGKFKASDDSKTLSILDSLSTKNNSTRPFYIYLTSKMMYTSDVALSEGLGNSCKELIEDHSDYVIDFLYSNSKIVERFN